MTVPKDFYRQVNSNYGIAQAGANLTDNAGVVIGAKSGFPEFYQWQGLQFSHAIGNPLFVAHFDDFVGADATLSRFTLAGASGSQSSQAAAGGVLRLTTGGTNTNFRSATLNLNWLVSNGWTLFEARVASVAAITTRAIEIGLSDATSETNGLAFSDHSYAASVDVATDAAIFAYDTADTENVNFVALSVKNGGTPQGTLTSTPPVAGTYNIFRVGINEDGDAYFWLDGELVATHTSAVQTTALLTPWISVLTRTGSASSIDVDYVTTVGYR